MKIDFNQWGNDEPEHKEIDFAAVKAICNGNITAILEHYLPDGRVVQGEYVCATKYGGAGSSCSTNIRTGVGSDFGSGEAWGDIIDLVAQIEDVSMSEAARRLQDFLSCGSTDCRPVPIIPQQSPQERYAAGQRIALGLWVESESCPHNHPYLTKKGVNADNGIRLHQPTGNILVPLYDEHGVLWSVQRIDADGGKKLNYCGKLSGNFYIIGGERDTVYICEGYATAQTVAMATGKTAVMAVSAGNLATVGEKIGAMFPSSHLVFAADNDQKPDTDENPGIKAATAAVKQVGRGTIIAPPFPVGQKGDWNDYAIQHGGKAARELLLTRLRSKKLFVDINTMVLTEPKFLIDGCIETPCTSLIFGESGGGKSFIVLDWALHVASGKQWLGKKTQEGSVFYICGEGRHAMPRRVAAWKKHHGINIPYNKFMMSSVAIDFTPESVDEMLSTIDCMAGESTGNPVLIIIDTLARALVGNENATEDMNKFVRELDKIQSRYQCAVIVVHHPGLSDARRSRGNSALKGALDAELLIDKQHNVIEWTKEKDMPKHPPIKYELKQIIYGEGKHNNSCVVKYELEFKREKPETRYRAAAVKALSDAIKSDDMGDRCLKDTFINCFIAQFEDATKDAAYKAFTRKRNKNSHAGEMQKMEESGEIKIDGQFVIALQSQKEITDGMFDTILQKDGL